MAAEIVETQKVYARCNALIQPQWLEEKGRHLLSYQYSEPEWQVKAKQVSALQSASLFGLPVYAKRKVNYGPVDAKASRAIFIWALVHGDYQPEASFIHHNQKLLHEIHQLEAKSRRQDVLVDDKVIYAFYDTRIKAGIYNGPAFMKWWKTVSKQQPELLNMQREQLMQHDASSVASNDYPDTMNFNGMRLKLDYVFDPKLKHDGVCLNIPLVALNNVDAVRCEWLVPGLIEEKVIALIRSLPKNLRRNFVPVPDFAKACLQSCSVSDKPLTVELAEQLRRMTGVTIPLDAWRPEQLEDYLLMSFRLLDADGKLLEQGHNLLALQQKYGEQAVEQGINHDNNEFERDDITRWDFGDISQPLTMQQSGMELQLYPALKKEGKKVALRLFESQPLAQRAMRGGLRQLIRLQLSEQLRNMQQTTKGLQALCLLYRQIGNCQELGDELLDAAIEDAFVLDPLPANQAQYEQVLQQGRELMTDSLVARYRQTAEILELYQQISKRLKNMPVSWLEAGADIQAQLQGLLPKHFLLEVPAEQLQHYPRYLKAIVARLDKLDAEPAKDRALRVKVHPYQDNYRQRSKTMAEQKRHSELLEQFRWLIEEYRVSLFAQNLKTAQPVSQKRLNQLWEEVKLGA